MDTVLYAMLKNKITEIRQKLLKVVEDASDMNSRIVQNTNNIEKKLDKNQGESNSGKITGINESGDIVPMFPQGVTYNEDTQCLEYGADEKLNLNAGIQLDDTLSKVGYAADAASVGELKGDLGEYTYTKTEGMYVNTLGEILPYEGAYDIYAIDVSLFNGRTISGHTTGYKDSAFGAFYKKNGSVISVVTNSGTDLNWEYNFIIPNNADKFVIDYRTSGSGNFTVYIDNLTQSFIDFAKETKKNIIECVTVGTNGDYPSIIKALKGTNDNVKVRVLAGTYDLVHEFREYYGDDFFVNYDGYDAHTDDHFYKGMWINNGREIVFDANAKVIFNYNEENNSVKSQFSVFSMGYNATIRGLNLVYSGCRYAIHDDFARLNGQYHSGTNVIENCTFDGNPYFPAVIGGGFGDDNEYIIRNCLFLNNNQNNDVTYHNTYYGNAKSKLIIENCYGNKDCKMFWYGSSELISDCIVTNSKFNSISCVAHSYEPNTNENIRLFAWNNITTN